MSEAQNKTVVGSSRGSVEQQIKTIRMCAKTHADVDCLATAVVLSDAADTIETMRARCEEMVEMAFYVDVALAAAMNDQITIERWMLPNETHSECKIRLIAEGRAALGHVPTSHQEDGLALPNIPGETAKSYKARLALRAGDRHGE